MIKFFRKRAKNSPSGTKSGEVDFSSMTKEEIAAYYEKKMQQQAENQTKIIQNLRGELTKSNEKLQNQEDTLTQTREQLSTVKQNLNNTESKLKSTLSELSFTTNELEKSKEENTKAQREISLKQAEIDQKQTKIDQKQAEIDQKQAEIDQKQTEISKNKEEISKKQDEISKLTKTVNSFKDLMTNALDNVRERHYDFFDCLKDENIPSVDIYNLKSLNIYFEGLITTLLNSLSALYTHRNVALSLGTSEKTKKGQVLTDNNEYSSDAEAQKDGASELEKAASFTREDSDEKDFEEQSSELKVPADKIKVASVKDNPEGLTPEQVDNVILSGCTTRIKSGAEGLSEVTSLLKNSAEEIKNDTSSLNETLRKEKHYVSTTSGNTVAGIISFGGKQDITMYCEECGCQRDFKYLHKNKRINETLTADGSLQSIRKVLTSVQLVRCCTCGAQYEINPAEFTQVNFTRNSVSQVENSDNASNASGASSEHVQNISEIHSELVQNASKTDKTANESALAGTLHSGSDADSVSNTAIVQRNRKKLYRQIRNTQDAVTDNSLPSENAFIHEEGKLPVINPFGFNAEVFGHAPAFIKSKLSTALFAICGTQFSQLGAPKNRIFCYFEGNGFDLGREHLTGAINAFARAYLHSVTKQIKKDILSKCPVIIMDESTLRVNETARIKQAEGKGIKSQIWTLNSSWTSALQASWYCVSPSRSADVVIDILKNDLKNQDGSVVTKYLLTDGFAGYDAGIKELNKIEGVFLKSCRCMTHGRRGLWKYLRNNRMLDIYSQLLPEGSSFFDFKDNLEKYRQTKKGKKLTDNSVALLIIFYLINALFVIDSCVVRKHDYICTTEEFKQDLLQARNKYSRPIVDTLFDTIRLYIANNPKIIVPRVSKEGVIRFTQNKRYPESAALIYLLNYETELKRFTESADIELSTSKAERSLKLGICSRKAFMTIASEDGGHAFADYQTIVNTCILNRVPVLSYIIWLVANIKYRMQLLEREGRGCAMGLTMPKKEKYVVTHADGSVTKELIAMYDKRNVIDFDKIDVKGLAPYDYRRYLDEHNPRV